MTADIAFPLELRGAVRLASRDDLWHQILADLVLPGRVDRRIQYVWPGPRRAPAPFRGERSVDLLPDLLVPLNCRKTINIERTSVDTKMICDPTVERPAWSDDVPGGVRRVTKRTGVLWVPAGAVEENAVEQRVVDARVEVRVGVPVAFLAQKSFQTGSVFANRFILPHPHTEGTMLDRSEDVHHKGR